MYVIGNKVEKVHIELDEKEIKRIITTGSQHYSVYTQAIQNKFYDDCKLPRDAYLTNGKWEHEVEHHGSHSWYSDEIIRDATEKEISFIEALQHFRESILIDELK